MQGLDPSFEACRHWFKKADWIAYPGEDAVVKAPVGVRFFRREWTVRDEQHVTKAYAAFCADNYGHVWVNGEQVGRVNGFHDADLLDITGLVKKGTNVVSLTCHNAGDRPNPAGVVGVIYLEFERGEPLAMLTGKEWRAAKETEGPWRPAESLGLVGRKPWGEIAIRSDVRVNQYVFSRLTYALSALHLGSDMARANYAIAEAVERIRLEHQSAGEFGLHWMGGIFYRIYGLFGPGGPMEGRLSDQASAAIWALFADWAHNECQIADLDPEHTWRIWGSENHSAQRDATAWAAARIILSQLGGRGYRYQDGSTVEQHLSACRVFLKRYFRERIKRGMLIEISPSGYGSRTLQGWHNIYDFTDDPELKFLVRSALDVWWADWAQEQLGGMRGGGKTRLYPGAWALSQTDRNRAMSWFYLGRGKPAHHHETLPVMATSTYRLPLVVMDIALDPVGRGVYECKSRKLGRYLDDQLSKALSTPGEPIYDVDPNYGGIVRYSYCTPDFIMGTLMLENRPTTYWTNISQQNRWHGVIFAGHQDSTLYPRCDTDRSSYNAHWAIQNKGTLIAQKLRYSDAAKAMRVYFSIDLIRQEKGGWIFARAARAFAAVKIVHGSWQWEDKRWLRCEDEYTPIIIEVVRSQDYQDNPIAFQQAILQQDLRFEKGVLHYTGLNGTGEFTFFVEGERLPELNGSPIDLAPDYAFRSPFLNEDWASGIVHIGKGSRELTIDVRAMSKDD